MMLRRVMISSVMVLFTVAVNAELRGFNDLKLGKNSKVVLCHVPPDDPTNAHTITVNENAVEAHLAHGDYMGECTENCDELDCDDGNACTVNSCVPSQGCIYTPREHQCMDIIPEGSCPPTGIGSSTKVELHLQFHPDVSIYMLRDINDKLGVGVHPNSDYDTFRNNPTIDDALQDLATKFPEAFAILGQDVTIEACMNNIEWGCESGHPSLNDQIQPDWWHDGQTLYRRYFKSLDHAPGGEPDMDYCISFSPSNVLGYFDKFVSVNRIGENYWTTPSFVKVMTMALFSQADDSCLEQRAYFQMSTDLCTSVIIGSDPGTDPETTTWTERPTFKVKHNKVGAYDRPCESSPPGFTNLDQELYMTDTSNPYVDYNYAEWQAELYHTGLQGLVDSNDYILFWARSDVLSFHIDPTGVCDCSQ